MSADGRLDVLNDGKVGLDRRGFLGRCAGCALLASCGAASLGSRVLGKPAGGQSVGKPRGRLVFSHIPPGQPTWPYISYDYESRKRELTRQLVTGCPEVEFLPVTVHNAEEAKRLLAEDRDKTRGIAGYLCYMVGIWTGAPQTIAEAGKPTLYVDDLYSGSGEFLIAYAAARRAGKKNVAGVSSSRIADVLTAARTFGSVRDAAAAGRFADDCMAAVRKTYKAACDEPLAAIDAPPKFNADDAVRRLRESTILLVGRPMQPIEPVITQTLGTRIVPIDFRQLDQAYRKADQAQASEYAEAWIRGAAAVEPAHDEIHRSAAMYIGMRDLMKQHGARAIAINCLGGFYGGQMAAYPCLGFSQLNSDGLVGACEADMKSTLTMLAMSHLVGRPGYISDPVIDTSKNQIIYAHCVAMTKADGPAGKPNAYQILSHSEDRKGASMRSLLPLGRMTTTIEVDPVRKEILMHQGKAVANIDDDRACRTKLAVEVKGDIDRLMSFWDQWGWHRVTFYGDLRQPVEALAASLRYKVIEEA
jgi:hypothetical protein